MSHRKAPLPRPGVLKIRPYQQGASEIEGREQSAELIKLSSNESTFGPSPAALEAYAQAAGELFRYPDGSQSRLRRAIAEVYGLQFENIVCGNGSDELIALTFRAFAGEDDEVLLSTNRFVMCDVHASAIGARVVIAPERDDRVDVDALLDRVTERTRVVCIANPNNPSGTWLPRSEIHRLWQGLPPDVVLLLDGAYAEYVIADDYSAGAELVLPSANVVMTRTFSKIYGLSALRIGWAYLPDNLLDAVQRIRTPFNANAAAMAAAEAAVRDQDYVARLREHNARWLKTISDQLRGYGLEVVPSVANFYLIRFPAGCGLDAYAAESALHDAGIIPRPMGGGNDAELRITVGQDHENQAVLAVFESLLGPAAKRSGRESAHG